MTPVPAINPSTQPASVLEQERNAAALPDPNAAAQPRPAMDDPHHSLPASYFALLPQPGPPPAHLLAAAAAANPPAVPPPAPLVPVPSTLLAPVAPDPRVAVLEAQISQLDTARLLAEQRATESELALGLATERIAALTAEIELLRVGAPTPE